jgi:hypothetical protein
MLTLRAFAVISLAFVPVRAAAAQELARELRPPGGIRHRFGHRGRRYVALQHGTVWEVEISDRATTGSWEADDFVGIRRIWAPRDGYDWLLSKSGNVEQAAAVKLVRRRVPAHGP